MAVQGMTNVAHLSISQHYVPAPFDFESERNAAIVHVSDPRARIFMHAPHVRDRRVIGPNKLADECRRISPMRWIIWCGVGLTVVDANERDVQHQ